MHALVPLLVSALLVAAPAGAEEAPAAPEGALEGEVVEEDGALFEVRDGRLVPFGEEPDEPDEPEAPAPQAPEPAAPVVQVTASRVDKGPAATVSVEVFDAEQMREVGATTLADVLQRMPGMSVTSSLGTGQEVSVDGLDPKHVLILVDGRPLNGRVNDRVDPSRLPVSAARIERIEVVRGPMSALYGSEAMGGVINIVTKRPGAGVGGAAELMTRLSTQGLTTRQLSVSGHGNAGPVLVQADASLLHEVGFDRGRRDDEAGVVTLRPDGQMDSPHRRQATGSLEAGVFLGDWHARAYGLLMSHEVETRVSRAAPFRDYAADGQARVGVGLTGDLAKGHALDVDARYDRFTHRYQRLPDGEELGAAPFCEEKKDGAWRLFDPACARPPRVVSDASQDDLRLEATWTGQLLEGLPFARELNASAGVVSRYEHVTRENGEGEDTLPGGGDRLSGALYGELLYRPFSWLSFVPGARADVVTPGAGEDAAAVALGPKLSTRVQLPAGLAVRASYGQGFRMPSFQERFLRFDHSQLGYIVEGNPDLVPETSHGGRAGLSVATVPGVRLEADLFANVLSNLIVEKPVRVSDEGIPVYVYENVARAMTSGLSLNLALLETNGVSAQVGYQYLFRAVDASGCPPEDPWLCGDGEGASRLPLRPTHSGNALVRWRLAPTGTVVFGRADFLGERPASATASAPGYVMLGAGVRQPLGELAELGVTLDNLLDSYDPVYGPKPGRSVALTLRSTF